MKVGLSFIFIFISELRVRVKITLHDHISQKNIIEGSRTKWCYTTYCIYVGLIDNV